jgi:polyisoprenoid-binding protein YceI
VISVVGMPASPKARSSPAKSGDDPVRSKAARLAGPALPDHYHTSSTTWSLGRQRMSCRPLRDLISARAAGTMALLAWLGALAAPAHAEPVEFVLDPEHISITFFAHHLGYADMAGMFLEAEGSFRYDEAAQELSDLRVVVRTASVFTNHERRDQHLRSPDFLNVREFPEMVFVGTGAERLGADTGLIHGELTLLGVTRPLTLEARLNKAARYPFLDEHYAIGVDATGSIRRSEFGMTYGVEHGWVGDEIRIVIGFEAIRQE